MSQFFCILVLFYESVFLHSLKNPYDAPSFMSNFNFTTMSDQKRRASCIVTMNTPFSDISEKYDFVNRKENESIFNLQGYCYLFGEYASAANDAFLNFTSSNDPVPKSYSHRSSSAHSSPPIANSLGDYQDLSKSNGDSITVSKVNDDQPKPQKPRISRPRTVKQKDKRRQKEMEKESLTNERWRCPDIASGTENDDVDCKHVTILPLSFDERSVDCDGINENGCVHSRSISSVSISTPFDDAFFAKTKPKKSRFPSLSRLFDGRYRRKTIDCPEIIKFALSNVHSSILHSSERKLSQINQFEANNFIKSKSQFDLNTDMESIKNIRRPTSIDRTDSCLKTPNSSDDFRKEFVQGLWSCSFSKPVPVSVAPSKNESVLVSRSIDKSADSGYESPVPTMNGTRSDEKCRNGEEISENIIDEELISKTSYEKFDTRRASLFNEFFGNDQKIDNQNQNDQVYDRIENSENKPVLEPTIDKIQKMKITETEAINQQKWAPCLQKGVEPPRPTQSDARHKVTEKLRTAPANARARTNVKMDPKQRFPIIIAIDFGTAYSGYAYTFRDKKDEVYIMRRLNTNDPGAPSPKCPTCILLEPDGRFHSFGWEARDFYHDLEPESAARYLYFECFKLILDNEDLNRHLKIPAVNGIPWPAIDVLAHCLRYLKKHSLIEISECTGFMIDSSHVQWVITVPAIWRQSAKQLMRLAAYQAGIASPEKYQQLIIALEPEAAALYCTKLKGNEFLPPVTPPKTFLSLPTSLRQSSANRGKVYRTDLQAVQLEPGNAYMVVDCGGGTVDITVHQLAKSGMGIAEIYKASGGPHGSTEMDRAFESLLCDIFSADFMNQFRVRYPATYTDLMLSFESRKRAAHPYKNNPFNVALPFSFLEFYRKKFGHRVECAVKRYEKKQHVTWNTQGMLRLSSEMMSLLFMPTMVSIVKLIDDTLQAVRPANISYLFLVGGFAESPMLQHEIRQAFEDTLKVIIPNQASTAVLKGAVLFGLCPQLITVRKSRYTYGIGVLHPFDPIHHPSEKRVSKNGQDFCKDVFDKFVTINDPIQFDQKLIRHYCPASNDQTQIIIQIYCTESANPKFVTEPGVKQCAVLKLNLEKGHDNNGGKANREIMTTIKFGDTELMLQAIDVHTGASVNGCIDFLM